MNKNKIYLVERLKTAMAVFAVLSCIIILVLWLCAGEDQMLRGAAAVLAGIFCVGAYLFFCLILKPYLELRKLYRLMANGYFSESLADFPVQIDREIEQAEKEIMSSFDKNQILSLSKKQAEYLALQNQINPHFLYNTLEGIRSEAIIAGMDSVAEMTEALATFFRYTISRVDHLVTLEDELANIENYYVIQQYRFGERLSLSIEYEEDSEMEALSCRIPKLTLQPIVENSIYHGLEEKVGKGSLKIRITRMQDHLLITISDDGVGMEEEKVEELNRRMSRAPMEDVQVKHEKQGGIAMVNVNNRIKLLFGEEYGLYFYSTKGIGTDVEITLPVLLEETSEDYPTSAGNVREAV